jgi:hypothetical protein
MSNPGCGELAGRALSVCASTDVRRGVAVEQNGPYAEGAVVRQSVDCNGVEAAHADLKVAIPVSDESSAGRAG